MKSYTRSRVGAYQEKSSSILTIQRTPVTKLVDELHMPPQLNLYDSVLRRLERICKLNYQKKIQKGKRHMLLIVRLQLDRCLAYILCSSSQVVLMFRIIHRTRARLTQRKL